MSVFIRVFIVVKRQHGQGHSYKGQYLIGTGLHFQRFSLLASWWEARQPPGRQGAGGTESFIPCSGLQPGEIVFQVSRRSV